MTTLLSAELETPEAAPRSGWHRRWLLAAFGGTVVIALVVAGTWYEVYAHTYQPLTNDGTTVDVGGARAGHVGETTDGVNDTYYALLGPAKSTATIEYTMSNSGSHAVKVLGLDRQAAPHSITGVKWGPLVNGPDGTVGALSQARQFPLILKPHTAIVLEVSLIKDGCGGSAGGPIILDVPLKWVAYGIDHTWNFTMTSALDNLPILICPPKAALRRLDRSR